MEYKPVNWVQGMNVSAAHFVETENFMSERIYQALSLGMNDFSYGLLPRGKDKASISLSLHGRGEQSKVVLTSYHGVVKGGVVIDYDDSDNGLFATCDTLDVMAEDSWNVVLTVSPFERNPSGVPNMEEQPPRYPNVEPSYKLSLMARLNNKRDDCGPLSVVVGLLRKNDENFALAANFIPPSLTVRSCEELEATYNRFSSYLSDIKMSLSIVLEKAYEQQNKTTLVNNIMLICRELLRGFSSFYFDWCSTGEFLAPYRLVEMLNHFCDSFRLALSFMPRAEKEDMLNYFKEWIGLAPSTFEQMLEELVSHRYSHTRIGESFHLLECFLKNSQELFVSLSQLEQIGGKRKEDMVIYFSDKQSDANKSRDSWLTVNR